MSELRVRLDPLNPGQFFACCGLMELMELEHPGALARFELDRTRPRVAAFAIDCARADDLASILVRLKGARPVFLEDEVDDFKICPVEIGYNGRKLTLDWWLDRFRIKANGNLKCWGGNVSTEKLFTELLRLQDMDGTGEDLFERSRIAKDKFGVDPRSAWDALDVGFSPDRHGGAAVFPAVEILAAIGLQGFRPDTQDRANVGYSLWLEPLPAAIGRVAFRSAWSGLPRRSYVFRIQPRGQGYKNFTFASEKEND